MSNKRMDIRESRTQAKAVRNFERNLSSLVMKVYDTEEFKNDWLYLRHLPQMQPFLHEPLKVRLAAAIEHFGDLSAFTIEREPYYSDNGRTGAEEIFYIGHTESISPANPLEVSGIFTHKGKVRAALETAIQLLLLAGCYDVNEQEFSYEDETGDEVEMPDRPKLKVDLAAFKELSQGTDELADFLRNVNEVSQYHLQRWNAMAEECIEPYQLYPITYKCIQDGENVLEMNRQSGFPYTPIGQHFLVTKDGIEADMPHVNLEKYLQKIFHFNLDKLRYEL